MEPRPPRGPARESFERFVRWTIEEELPAAPGFIPPGEREAFQAYYRNLPAAGDEPALARYLRGMWRGEAGWTARWIAARLVRFPDVRVVDAGSGFGTYSMRYAAVGADVTGVDLGPVPRGRRGATAAIEAGRLQLPVDRQALGEGGRRLGVARRRDGGRGHGQAGPHALRARHARDLARRAALRGRPQHPFASVGVDG